MCWTFFCKHKKLLKNKWVCQSELKVLVNSSGFKQQKIQNKEFYLFLRRSSKVSDCKKSLNSNALSEPLHYGGHFWHFARWLMLFITCMLACCVKFARRFLMCDLRGCEKKRNLSYEVMVWKNLRVYEEVLKLVLVC